MATLINPTIVVNKPVKKKVFGYTISLDKKKPNQLTIKAKSENGQGRGIAGTIQKDGTIVIRTSHVKQLHKLLQDKKLGSKISLTLDLIYGPKRDKLCVLDKKNRVKFSKPLVG